MDFYFHSGNSFSKRGSFLIQTFNLKRNVILNSKAFEDPNASFGKILKQFFEMTFQEAKEFAITLTTQMISKKLKDNDWDYLS